MKKIFIDANIYLNFYDSNKADFKKLLNSLLEIKKSIFVTMQIASEVRRNKLEVAKRSLTGHFDTAKMTKVSLPKQFDTEILKIQDWNKESHNLHTKQMQLREELKSLIHETLNNIMLSQDRVSQVLEQLFQNAVVASENEIQLAKTRKELGNPPGKPSDPLGDQLSWEQFLEYSSEAENIWIITKDQDYFTNFDNKNYLNSFLAQELISRNKGNPSIFCFNSLAEGLKNFNEFSDDKIESLPSNEDLEDISKEELSSQPSSVESGRYFPIMAANEDGDLIQELMFLPPGFATPNHYIQYLRTYDSADIG